MFKLKNDIYWVGSVDRRLRNFENLLPLENGVSYNSFLIKDEKNCLLDTVDEAVIPDLVSKLENELQGAKLDYIVLHHMEPDHAAGLRSILDIYPEAKLVGNKTTFRMLEQFVGEGFKELYHEVDEGDSLKLGKHKLTFYKAQMVHWPEVMVSYEETEKVLFSADAFGSFGAFNGGLFDDELDYEKDFLDEARRYYVNIVGRFGQNVQNLLKKLEGLEIEIVATLHGPIIRKNIGLLLEKYEKWSSYTPEEDGVIVSYASMYGNMKYAAELFANFLAEEGVKNVKLYDVSVTDNSYIASEIAKYSHMAFFSVTYNMEAFPKMEELLRTLDRVRLVNRDYVLVESGTWAIGVERHLRPLLDKIGDSSQIGETVSFMSSVDEETTEKLRDLAKKMAKEIKG